MHTPTNLPAKENVSNLCMLDPRADSLLFPLLTCLFSVSSCSQHTQFCSDTSCFTAQCMKCNLITHKRGLHLLFSTNSVTVMGHPKHESACGDTALQLTKQQSQCGLQTLDQLSLQMCCSPCRWAVLPVQTQTPALSLLL